MFAIQVGSNDYITATYAGAETLAAPWVAITEAQYVKIKPGSKWVNGAVVAPSAPPPPTVAQQAAAAFSAGLTVTSTSTSTINGLYACDNTAQARFNRIMVYLLKNGTFPNAATTIVWVDMAGKGIVLTVAQFEALATAVADYVALLDDVMLGLATTLPPATATIA